VAGARHLIENWTYQLFIPGRLIQKKYSAFEQLRHRDVQALEIISRLEEIRHRNLACDLEYIKELCEQLCAETLALTGCLTAFHPVRYSLLANYQQKYAFYARLALAEEEPCLDPPYAQALSQPAAEELAGGKGAALSVIHSSLNLPVPPGVVVTTRAFHSFLAHNDLRKFIDRELARLGPDADREYDQVSRRIQERIHEAELPGELRRAVESSLQAQEMDKSLLAVRSSARAEDAQSSFAGQYHSALHVPVQDWEQAYASVLASKYSAHALYYRIRQGYTDRQTPMAVVIMPMLEPEVSGILYTRREHDPFRMDAYMVRGQGQELAAGSSYQAWAGFMTRNGQWEVEEEGRFQLDRDVLHSLYQAGQTLDRGFSSAQDVEWVLGPDRRVVIVQSRPLHFYPARASAPVQDHQAPVLGRGQWVSSGQASGNAYRMDSRESPFQLPLGCILLVSALPPELTPALDRVGAVVSEQGSPACHFASVAREAGVPVICGVSGLAGIQDDARISVDADQGLVLSGALFDSAGETRRSPPSGPPAGIQDRLDRALPPIAALHLRQPDTDDFRIQGCRSLHDIVRFAHEAGVREMFSLVGRRGLNRFGAKRLDSPLPLVMHLLDVGSGLALGSHKAKAVTVEQITSQPMRSLWSGLSSPGVQWNPQILHYDWDAYEKSGAHFTAVETSTQFSSYAIVARDYVHAMLRFGYHFAVVDAVVSETMEHNYLHFSFKGGGGQDIQRLQRLRIISAVLEKFGFSLRLTADMLEAWFDRRGPTESTANLQILGFVLGKTVLLDMRIESEEHVNRIAAEIVDHIYDFLPVQAKR
jgi:pyruvate,water dikinase